jgi:hypothetical protein
MRSLPPYALAVPEFRFRALAAVAGRASLGGARELVIGVLLGARLTDGVVGEYPLPLSIRQQRAAAARIWLGSLALPPSTRATLLRLLDATATNDRRALSEAFDALLALASPTLDGPSRNELRRVSGTVVVESA